MSQEKEQLKSYTYLLLHKESIITTLLLNVLKPFYSRRVHCQLE